MECKKISSLFDLFVLLFGNGKGVITKGILSKRMFRLSRSLSLYIYIYISLSLSLSLVLFLFLFLRYLQSMVSQISLVFVQSAVSLDNLSNLYVESLADGPFRKDLFSKRPL